MLDVNAPSRDEAKAELESVLASAVFLRSARLSQLLSYLCLKSLNGDGDEVKEYQIGVEVLGRSASFDPTEDAAARVEVHRLRKRLRDYYESEGAPHRFRIEIPLGRYTPVFHTAPTPGEKPLDSNGSGAPVALEPAQPVTPVASAARGTWLTRNPWLAIVAVAIVALAAISFAVARSRRDAAEQLSAKVIPPPSQEARPSAPAASLGLIRIACGRATPLTDRWGEVWEADRDFEGGQPFEIHRQFVARAHDPKIYQQGRTGDFSYKIPLAPGVYELHLHFVEGTFGPAMPAGGGEISRIFDIEANGKLLLWHFDIYSDAGGSNIADVRAFKDISPGPDGLLRLAFHGRTGSPLMNAIEIAPAALHRLNPVRLVAQEGFYTDSSGVVWKPDRYNSGGQSATHAVEIHGTRDPELFARERYGHFDYAIPVDAGTYRLSLYLSEKHFGPGNPAGGDTGTRVFDVTCNGVMLLHDFDMLKDAGANQAVVKTFHGLKPNGQGKLLVSFNPVHDYASLYALEVIDESN